MDNMLQSYNLAIEYIQKEKFEEASLTLEHIVRDFPSFSKALWAYGLIDVLSGYPHKGLKKWRKRKDGIFSIEQELKLVEQELPLYENLYNRYNQAIQMNQECEFQTALKVFEDLLSFRKKLPLPVDFYYGYLVCKCINEENPISLEVINAFPNYVKNSSVIREFREWQEAYETEKQTSNTDFFRKRKVVDLAKMSCSKKLLYGTSVLASMLIGATGMWAYIGSGNFQRTSVIDQAADSEEYKNTLKQEIEKLKLEQDDLKMGLDRKGKELRSQNQQLTFQMELIQDAEIDLLSLRNEASFHTYLNGLRDYKQKNFKKAAESLERSLTYHVDEYYSDDALYFLIKCKQKLKKPEAALRLSSRFLTQKSKCYTDSPYRDEVMLVKATLLIVSGQENSALALLEMLQKEFPEAWTTQKAKDIIHSINGGS